MTVNIIDNLKSNDLQQGKRQNSHKQGSGEF